jgi:hypothetical protein
VAYRHRIVVLALCHCRIRLGVANGALLLWERESTLRRGDHRGGELVRASRRGGFASGVCAVDCAEIGCPHGAASGAGVLAAVMTKMEVTTKRHGERRGLGLLGLLPEVGIAP